MLDTLPPATSTIKGKTAISLGVFILRKFSIFSILCLKQIFILDKIGLGRNLVLGKINCLYRPVFDALPIYLRRSSTGEGNTDKIRRGKRRGKLH